MKAVNPLEIQALVHQASQVVSHYWPMTTFVHHNPIRSLEKFPFHQAVQLAQRFNGGQGYLPNVMYRQLVASGRIAAQHVDAAVGSLAQQNTVEMGGQTISQFDVMHAHLLHGISVPAPEALPALIQRHPQGAAIQALAHRLKGPLHPQPQKHTLARAETLTQWCDQALKTELAWQLDREVIKWCEAFLDEGQASWPMPGRERGFYAAWRTLAAEEWSACGIAKSGKKVKALPVSPEEALQEHLDVLAIPAEYQEAYLSLHLSTLYGWASFIHWRSEQRDYSWQKAYPIDLVQYLAVRLFYERALVQQACQGELGIGGSFPEITQYIQSQKAFVTDQKALAVSASQAAAWQLVQLAKVLQLPIESLQDASIPALYTVLDWLEAFPEAEHGPVWLKAYEAGYQEDLLQQLQTTLVRTATEPPRETRPLAQLMFCIDVRSEPFRRHLEAVGNYETIGFAGFFGLPITCRSLEQQHDTAQCPAIVEPQYHVHEIVRNTPNEKARAQQRRFSQQVVSTLQSIFYALKNHVLTPYVMVESLGWFFGWHLLERTFFPGVYRRWQTRLAHATMPPLSTTLTVDQDVHNLGLSDAAQCTHVETALRTMGLTSHFARLVVVTGHTSMSDNNPYEAALNCGACGGNSGQPNARLFAAIANKPSVRRALAQNGIVIPEDTYFIGAVHNTTTDAVDLYDLEDLPDSHRVDVARLKTDLQQAAMRNNQERCRQLPGVSRDLSPAEAVREMTRRSGDWSETRPEWGLSGNAAFIIGRRTLTQGLNLQGRAFLNSYDERLDPTGELLEGVLMGPMVVGQWINAEHYFSATDPEVYGSGSKVYHNVVGRFGVMSGPQSDLRMGLAWQSVASGELTYHEPLRLLVAIQAPRQRILEIVNRQPMLKQLCDNAWIHLVALDHDSPRQCYRYKPFHGWNSMDCLTPSEHAFALPV